MANLVFLDNLKAKDQTIISVGDIVCDLVVPVTSLPLASGANQLIPSLECQAGGAGNFLIMGTRLGFNLVALGAVGDDYYGGQVIAKLNSAGVETHAIHKLYDGETITVVALVDKKGNNVFLGKLSNKEYPKFWLN